MENSVNKKAKLILAGLAAMPALATASTTEHQANVYCSPYSDCTDVVPGVDLEVTGLSAAELKEGRELVRELNQIDVVAVQDINITKAPRIRNRYNMPDPKDVIEARAKNLERLAKLRRMIEAAK